MTMFMYRIATLSDCEKVHSLICEMECKHLPFDRFFQYIKSR